MQLLEIIGALIIFKTIELGTCSLSFRKLLDFYAHIYFTIVAYSYFSHDIFVTCQQHTTRCIYNANVKGQLRVLAKKKNRDINYQVI